MMNTQFLLTRSMRSIRLLTVLLGLLCLLSKPAGATITRGATDRVGGHTIFGPGVTVGGSANWSKTTAAGSLLVAMVSVWGDSGSSTLTIPSGFTLQGSRVTNPNGIWVACYAYVNAPAQTNPGTFSFKDNSNTNYGIAVALIEYQGAATSNPLDVNPTGLTGDTTTSGGVVSSPNSGTLSQANEVVVAGMAWTDAGIFISGPTNGFTSSSLQDGPLSSSACYIIDKIVSSTGSVSTSVTIQQPNPAAQWVTGLWSFK